ncbi:hypothetical protein RDI58_009476 [Solanum bulbocastanum]|uniref:25.3 kDa vesicle transport protein n=1 Tax=Solanum bulbocastanum TaxID=147425 RepID=A0AAN8U2K3_SOLBU
MQVHKNTSYIFIKTVPLQISAKPLFVPSNLLPAPIQTLNKFIKGGQLSATGFRAVTQAFYFIILEHVSFTFIRLKANSCTDRKYNALVVVISGNVVRIDDPVCLRENMVKLTLIARVTDGLPLAEGLDDGRDVQNADFYKQQVKALFKNLSMRQNDASRMSIETGPYVFQYPFVHVIFPTYIIEGHVCYLTMCDRSYPKKLAFQYLEDLKNEFERANGSQIETAARPYAFIKFDTFIQKTKKLYQDTRTQRNISKLNDELYEVHQIMTRNVQEVLGVGEKLDQVSQMSSRLTSESRIYADKAKDLNRQALIRKWAPVAIVLGVVILFFWLRTKIW